MEEKQETIREWKDTAFLFKLTQSSRVGGLGYCNDIISAVEHCVHNTKFINRNSWRKCGACTKPNQQPIKTGRKQGGFLLKDGEMYLEIWGTEACF